MRVIPIVALYISDELSCSVFTAVYHKRSSFIAFIIVKIDIPISAVRRQLLFLYSTILFFFFFFLKKKTDSLLSISITRHRVEPSGRISYPHTYTNIVGLMNNTFRVQVGSRSILLALMFASILKTMTQVKKPHNTSNSFMFSLLSTVGAII